MSLLVWANEAIVTTYTYDFVNYHKSLQTASQYFTPDGWQAFMTTLNKSGKLQAVINKKMVVTAVAGGTPLILEQGIMNGIYTWKVQIPLLVTYQTASNLQNQAVIATMLIARTPRNIGVRGLGITQLIIAPMSYIKQ